MLNLDELDIVACVKNPLDGSVKIESEKLEQDSLSSIEGFNSGSTGFDFAIALDGDTPYVEIELSVSHGPGTWLHTALWYVYLPYLVYMLRILIFIDVSFRIGFQLCIFECSRVLYFSEFVSWCAAVIRMMLRVEKSYCTRSWYIPKSLRGMIDISRPYQESYSFFIGSQTLSTLH